MIKLVNGVEVPLTDAEAAEFAAVDPTETQWRLVRMERNNLLAASDWIVTKALETGTEVPSDWGAYRQALRDITTQEDPANITWPVAP